jgi:hypothetical protein
MYCTVADLKAEGMAVDGAAAKARAERLIRVAANWFEEATGQWFESRAFSAEAPMLLDGSGTEVLDLEVPIITITSVVLDDVELDADYYVVYNRRVPDDRIRPKIVLASTSTSSSVLTGGAGVWTKGNQNVELSGTFGYTDLIGGAAAVPDLVKQVLMYLVGREMPELCAAGGQMTRRLARAKSEATDDHSYTLDDLAASGGGPTGDAYVDRIVELYQAPMIARAI